MYDLPNLHIQRQREFANEHNKALAEYIRENVFQLLSCVVRF